MSAEEQRELAHWIDEYTPRLLSAARAFAHGAEEAEDIVQEVWIKAWRRREELREHPTPGAWLHRVTLNEGRAHLRRRERRRGLWNRWLGKADPEPVEPPTIDGELKKTRLWRAVAELPEHQRRVVILRIVEGLSTRQAAEVLGRAEGTVKASLHRGIKKLKATLEPTDVIPE